MVPRLGLPARRSISSSWHFRLPANPGPDSPYANLQVRCQDALNLRKWTKGGCSFPFVRAVFDNAVMPSDTPPAGRGPGRHMVTVMVGVPANEHLLSTTRGGNLNVWTTVWATRRWHWHRSWAGPGCVQAGAGPGRGWGPASAVLVIRIMIALPHRRFRGDAGWSAWRHPYGTRPGLRPRPGARPLATRRSRHPSRRPSR
jgi:hypothetical protein